MVNSDEPGAYLRLGSAYSGPDNSPLRAENEKVRVRDELRAILGRGYLLKSALTVALCVGAVGYALIIKGCEEERNPTQNVEVRVQPADSGVESRF